jgi:hypothetical protein
VRVLRCAAAPRAGGLPILPPFVIATVAIDEDPRVRVLTNLVGIDVDEAIVQLRGEGGARQVADARVAVVSSGGLTPTGTILLRRDR